MRQSKVKTLSIMNLESENKRRRAVMSVSALGVFTGAGIGVLGLFTPVIGTVIFFTATVVGFGFTLSSIKKIEANKKALAYQKALRAIQLADSDTVKEDILFDYRQNLNK